MGLTIRTPYMKDVYCASIVGKGTGGTTIHHCKLHRDQYCECVYALWSRVAFVCNNNVVRAVISFCFYYSQTCEVACDGLVITFGILKAILGSSWIR